MFDMSDGQTDSLMSFYFIKYSISELCSEFISTILVLIMKKILVDTLSNKSIDALRDAAIDFENKDINVSLELMNIASLMRPSGPGIKKKIQKYKQEINLIASEKKLKDMVNSGELAIIPVGFRCYTKMGIKNKFKITQPSLPFDSGFFPPSSIINILNNPVIHLSLDEGGIKNHTVCIKNEPYEIYGKKGIKFTTSSYKEIDSLAASPDCSKINKYLDSTFGYYTLDLNNDFVLAHYNWHKFSNDSKSNGVHDPKINLKEVSEMLNRRLDKMFSLIENSKYTFFIYDESQGYEFMLIDDKYYDLKNFEELKKILTKKFPGKSFFGTFEEFGDASSILQKINF